MVERAARAERRNWGVPLNVVVGASIALLSMTVYSPFGDILYLLFVAPPVGLFGFVLVLVAVINRRRRQALAMLFDAGRFSCCFRSLHSRTSPHSTAPSDG